MHDEIKAAEYKAKAKARQAERKLAQGCSVKTIPTSKPGVSLRCIYGFWRVVVSRGGPGHGKQIVRSLHTRDLARAREIVESTDIEKFVLANQADSLTHEILVAMAAGCRVLVCEAVEQYEVHCYTKGQAELTISRAAGVLAHFVRENGIGRRSITCITDRMISDFINTKKPTKLGTRRLWQAILSGFCRFCVKQRWLGRNPVDDIAIRVSALPQEHLLTKHIKPATEDEIQRILEHFPRDTCYHGMVLFANTYGLRISTIAHLRWDALEGNRIRVYTTKGRRVVSEDLTPELVEWVSEWRTHRRSQCLHVFPDIAERGARGTSYIAGTFQRELRKIGINNIGFHSFRKSLAERRINDVLNELGPKSAQVLTKFMMQHGYQELQKTLGHAIGSPVTANSYLPKGAS